MPDFLVQSDTRLERFLLRNRVMQWRIPILIDNRGVKVFEAGTKRELPLNGLKTRVSAGDTVRVVTPPPKPCADALQKEANTNFRDYAIVPGATPPADRKKRGYKPGFDDSMEDYLQARPKTVLIKDPAMMTLDGFLNGIATSEEFIYPIRYLIVVGHASITGSFHILISAGTSVEASVSYETLEEAVVKKYLVVDMDLMQPRPAGAVPAQLRLLGCSVGAQAPYMKKFKEALGGQITLIAPKFLMMPDKIAAPPGPIAYLGYDFTLHCPTPVKDRKTLLALYDAKSTAAEKNKDPRFTLRSGKHVPTKSWDDWVPRDLLKYRYSSLGKKLPKDPPVLYSPVMLPVLKVKARARRRFLVNEKAPYYKDPFTGGPEKQSIPLAKNTGNPADWKAAVRAWLLKASYKYPALPNKTFKPFDPSHPFPAYVRAGYGTMDEFMDGWDWQFEYDKAKKMLSYSPIRYEYRVWQPITTEPGNELIMNYFPTGKIPKRFSKLLPLEQLFVSDSYFFGVY